MNIAQPITIELKDGKKRRRSIRLSLKQVIDLQQFSHFAAKELIEDFKSASDREERARAASAISNLAKGWVSLQDAKREILGVEKVGVRKSVAAKGRSGLIIEPLVIEDKDATPDSKPQKSPMPTPEPPANDATGTDP